MKTFILNNHIYGITKAFQETNFQGRAEACGPKGYNPPNFINIVKAYRLKTVEIKTIENTIRANKENCCLLLFLRKADLMAIIKSSLPEAIYLNTL